MTMLVPEGSYTSSAALFERMVERGEANALIRLAPPLRTFLIGTLVERERNTEMVTREQMVYTLHIEMGNEREHVLQNVGDAALFLAGFFPGQTKGIGQNDSSLHALGEKAYRRYALRMFGTDRTARGETYLTAAENFGALVGVLNGIRADEPEPSFASFLEAQRYLQRHLLG